MIKKLLLPLALAAFFASCAQPTESTAGCPAKSVAEPAADRRIKLADLYFPLTYLPEPVLDRSTPLRSKEDLAARIKDLNPCIGTFPVKLRSEEHRLQIYAHWVDLFADAEAHQKKEGWTEDTHHFFAELHRQGDYLLVEGREGKAEEIVEACIATYPKSKRCHRSAVYLYLSHDVQIIDRAERSLTVLRAELSPDIDPEVESLFTLIYLHQRRYSEMLAQIDYVLAEFPDYPDAQMLKVLKKSILERATEQLRQDPS